MGAMIRWLFLLHRYLGIAVSLLMAMWCVSGVVMILRGKRLPRPRHRLARGS